MALLCRLNEVLLRLAVTAREEDASVHHRRECVLRGEPVRPLLVMLATPGVELVGRSHFGTWSCCAGLVRSCYDIS